MERTIKIILVIFFNIFLLYGCERVDYSSNKITGLYILNSDDRNQIILMNDNTYRHQYYDPHYGYSSNQPIGKIVVNNGNWSIESAGDALLVLDSFDYTSVNSGIWPPILETCGIFRKYCFCRLDEDEGKDCYVKN